MVFDRSPRFYFLDLTRPPPSDPPAAFEEARRDAAPEPAVFQEILREMTGADSKP
jgi:hypothetical protein